MKHGPVIPTESEQSIDTNRLELRPIRRQDAEVLFPILADPALYEYTAETPPESVDALHAVYASREGRLSPDGAELWLNWTVRVRTSGHVVGYMQATVAAAQADVAWVIGTRWQGRGYASEAAKAAVDWLCALGVPRIRASIHPDHVASRSVATHAGLQRTDEVTDGEELWMLTAWTRPT